MLYCNNVVLSFRSTIVVVHCFIYSICFYLVDSFELPFSVAQQYAIFPDRYQPPPVPRPVDRIGVMYECDDMMEPDDLSIYPIGESGIIKIKYIKNEHFTQKNYLLSFITVYSKHHTLIQVF